MHLTPNTCFQIAQFSTTTTTKCTKSKKQNALVHVAWHPSFQLTHYGSACVRSFHLFEPPHPHAHAHPNPNPNPHPQSTIHTTQHNTTQQHAPLWQRQLSLVLPTDTSFGGVDVEFLEQFSRGFDFLLRLVAHVRVTAKDQLFGEVVKLRKVVR